MIRRAILFVTTHAPARDATRYGSGTDALRDFNPRGRGRDTTPATITRDVAGWSVTGPRPRAAPRAGPPTPGTTPRRTWASTSWPRSPTGFASGVPNRPAGARARCGNAWPQGRATP